MFHMYKKIEEKGKVNVITVSFFVI
jgi:hypothetical protein